MTSFQDFRVAPLYINCYRGISQSSPQSVQAWRMSETVPGTNLLVVANTSYRSAPTRKLSISRTQRLTGPRNPCEMKGLVIRGKRYVTMRGVEFPALPPPNLVSSGQKGGEEGEQGSLERPGSATRSLLVSKLRRRPR
jgi:hypothetical protein